MPLKAFVITNLCWNPVRELRQVFGGNFFVGEERRRIFFVGLGFRFDRDGLPRPQHLAPARVLDRQFTVPGPTSTDSGSPSAPSSA